MIETAQNTASDCADCAGLPPTMEELFGALLAAKAWFRADGSPSALRQIEDVIARYEAAREAKTLPRVAWCIQFQTKDGIDVDRREYRTHAETARSWYEGASRNSGGKLALVPMIEATGVIGLDTVALMAQADALRNAASKLLPLAQYATTLAYHRVAMLRTVPGARLGETEVDGRPGDDMNTAAWKLRDADKAIGALTACVQGLAPPAPAAQAA